ncbi:MAG: hypothetical protein HYR63_26045 [Proteobacteria bacterium]|nr:hypothetical protein [Pseudomonadota bacterium]
MRVYAIVALFLVALAGVVWLTLWASEGLGDVALSANGIAAMIAGVVLSLLLGGGLMALVFYSSRKGYDDRAHHGDDPPAER